MSSIRVTNLFLAIIAACLLAIVGKAVVPDILPAAHAATPMRVEAPSERTCTPARPTRSAIAPSGSRFR